MYEKVSMHSHIHQSVCMVFGFCCMRLCHQTALRHSAAILTALAGNIDDEHRLASEVRKGHNFAAIEGAGTGVFVNGVCACVCL